MAVSVGGNKRPRTGTRLSVDSSDEPVFNPANPQYRPPQRQDSFNAETGESFLERLDRDYGPNDSLPRQFAVANNEFLNWRLDGMRDLQNFGGWLTGGPQNATAESVLGSWLRPGGTMVPYRSDPSRTGPDSRGRMASPRNAEKRAQQELTDEEAKTLKDYLLEAEGMMGNGPDFEAIRRRYLENTQQSDAKLQAMFNQLNGSYAANAAPIQASYDTAGAAINQAGAQGVANVNAGYDASRAAQTEQLAALDIQDAAAVLAQDGEMAADQGMSAGGISRDAANYAGLNATNAQSAQQFNTGLQGAAALGGAESRALLQRSLADNLAGLAFKESEYEPQKFDMKMRLAQSLQAAEQGNGLDPYQQAQLDQDLAQFIADQQQQAYENSVGQSESQRDIFFRLLEQYQGDPQKLQEMYAWMQENGLR